LVDLMDFPRKIVFAAMLSLLAGILELLFLPLPEFYQISVFFVTVLFPPLFVYFYGDYLKEKRVKEIEEALPKALFQIASFPKRASMEKIVESISESDYGALSEEFQKARRQIKSGISVAEAFEDMKKSDSRLLNRAVALLSENYKSGSDLSKAFKEVAEDVFEMQAISREATASLALQKYTLLVGGCLLVPVILGILLNVVSSLEFDLNPFGNAQETELKEILIIANQFYLVVFAALASYFVALQEGRRKKTILYFALLAPTALLLFHAVKELRLF